MSEAVQPDTEQVPQARSRTLVNPTDRMLVLEEPRLSEEPTGTVDEPKLRVDRRHRKAVGRSRGWLVRRVLLIADVTGLVSALLLAEWIMTQADNTGTIQTHDEILVFLAGLPGWIVVAKLYGLYDRDEERTDHSTADELTSVFQMISVCTWLFWVVTQLTGIAHPTTPKLALFWAASIGLISIARSAARAVARRQVSYLQNAVIVGADEKGQLIAEKLASHPEYGVHLVGFVDTESNDTGDALTHRAFLGDPGRLPALVRPLGIERAVIAFPSQPENDTMTLIRSLRALDVQVDLVPRLSEATGTSAGMHMVEGLPLLGLPPFRLSRSSALLKRAMDVAMSGLTLVVVSPLLLAIALAVKLGDRGPVLYRHERIGRGGEPIDVLKFRTMRLEACRGKRYGGETAEAMFHDLMADPERAREFSETYKLVDDPRVTRVGRLLRGTSLDELPQLVNALKGDLSLVGPRAITADELARYGDRVDDLLGVRPGITGYWQINGRSRLGYDDRVRLDLAYVSGWSLRLDLEILAKTVRALVSGRGAV